MSNPDVAMPLPPPPLATTPAWQTLAGGVIRTALGLVAGYLVRQGIADPSQSGAIVDVGTGVVLGALTVAWSVLQKVLAQRLAARAATVALALPAGSTGVDLALAMQQERR